MSRAPAGWSTVVVRVAASEVDDASGALWAAGVAGVEERAGADGWVELRAGVASDAAEDVRARLADRDVRVEPVVDDGLDRWRAFARPWRAGAHVVVVPTWVDRPTGLAAEDLVVELDPGRAFGSGAHPTTRLCLAELERTVGPGATVADVGCGSGVLAVVAALLGAEDVVAVDTDPEAVRATAENAARNGVGGRVRASTTPVEELDEAAHDVVVANIGAATLAAMAPALVRAVAPGGHLVLSGVLDLQVDAVRGAVEAEGATDVAVVADGEWRALWARRRRPTEPDPRGRR